jgi:uncharacterized protein
MDAPPFWRTTALADMSREQWESLCDGCAKCCLHKLEDEDSGEVYFTRVACRLLDIEQCRCTRYENRGDLIPGCLRLRHDNLDRSPLPKSCAYRRLAEGKDLPDWHPLVTGDPDSTHSSGNSMLGRAVPERAAGELGHHLLGIDEW